MNDITENPWNLTESEREELLRNAPRRDEWGDKNLERLAKVVDDLRKATEEFNRETKAWNERIRPKSSCEIWQEFEKHMRGQFR